MNQLSQFLGAKVEAQRAYFASGATLPYDVRVRHLKELDEALEVWEKPLCEALWTDLHKSYEEAVMTELSIVRGEIRYHLRHLRRWMRTRRVASPLKMFPSRTRIMTQPLGTSLIISPWNYPVQLLLNPLVGAISAGCTAVLKTSPAVPNVSRVLEQMIGSTFEERYIIATGGHRDVNSALLEQHFDVIFFTGSPVLGRTVMEAAAHNLTPVVLELGGKSPCIVDEGANVAISAKRIAWGKTINAGQTCIAPDYLMIHSSLKEEFIEAFASEIRALHGENPAESKHFGRMVSDRAFERVAGYIGEGKVLSGGTIDPESRYIEPTLLEVSDPNARVLSEEIFGPVMPVITFNDRSEVVEYIGERPHPLALYYYGIPRRGESLLRQTISGGACINDSIMHIVNEKAPFGGVGASGMGCYHGVESFRAFSHRRTVVQTPAWFDLPLRYMPYKLFPIIKKLI